MGSQRGSGTASRSPSRPTPATTVSLAPSPLRHKECTRGALGRISIRRLSPPHKASGWPTGVSPCPHRCKLGGAELHPGHFGWGGGTHLHVVSGFHTLFPTLQRGWRRARCAQGQAAASRLPASAAPSNMRALHLPRIRVHGWRSVQMPPRRALLRSERGQRTARRRGQRAPPGTSRTRSPPSWGRLGPRWGAPARWSGGWTLPAGGTARKCSPPAAGFAARPARRRRARVRCPGSRCRCCSAHHGGPVASTWFTCAYIMMAPRLGELQRDRDLDSQRPQPSTHPWIVPRKALLRVDNHTILCPCR